MTSRQTKYETARRAIASGDSESARRLLIQCASDGQDLNSVLHYCILLNFVHNLY